MKNKILFISLIIIIMALMIVFGYTNARYYFTASMTGKLDVAQTTGQISIYHPEWVGGYTVLDDGTGVFNVPQIPIEYSNIRYSVTNKVNDNINEEEIQYYIRIVAEDGSNNIPIEYDVYEYDNINNIYNNETGVGYGPFTLNAVTEQTQYYSIRVNYIDYATGIQYLKVQMIRKSDNTLKVISEAPLNMQYTGNNVTVNFRYYLYETNPPQEIGTSQILNIPDNINIDFTNEEQLKSLKITFPENYIFHDARSQLTGWAESSSVSIPEGNLEEYWIDVYMTAQNVVPIILNYYDYSSYTVDETTGIGTYSLIRDEIRVVVNRGITIDFTNLEQLNNLQIPLPDNYALKGLDGALVINKLVDTSVQIPSTTTDNSHNINVYMNPEGVVTVNVSYYNWRIDNEYSGYLLSENSIEVPRGTKIDFTDTESLTTLGIPIPSGYTLENAYCSSIDSSGTGSSEYTIPMEGATSVYNIDVVLLGSTITVPVKFYNSSGAEISSTTVNMEADGTYTFTTEVCRTLCPTLEAMTSFTVYIYNAATTNTCEIGNTTDESRSFSVRIDCNTAYGDGGAYKLKDAGSYIYIKAWW